MQDDDDDLEPEMRALLKRSIIQAFEQGKQEGIREAAERERGFALRERESYERGTIDGWTHAKRGFDEEIQRLRAHFSG